MWSDMNQNPWTCLPYRALGAYPQIHYSQAMRPVKMHPWATWTFHTNTTRNVMWDDWYPHVCTLIWVCLRAYNSGDCDTGRMKSMSSVFSLDDLLALRVPYSQNFQNQAQIHPFFLQKWQRLEGNIVRLHVQTLQTHMLISFYCLFTLFWGT